MAEIFRNVVPVQTILTGLGVGILGGAVSVDTTATKVPTTPIAKRKSIILRNDSGQTAYIGDSTVTTAGLNGFKFNNGEVLAIDLSSAIDVYVVLAAGSGNIYYLEAG